MDLSPLIVLATILSTSLAFIRSGPHIVREPVDTLYDQDSNIASVSLFCEAEGELPLSVAWKKDGFLIDNDREERFIVTGDYLTITSPNRATDEGTYQCVVSNSYGTIISKEADLKFAYVELYSLNPLPGVELTINTGACISCSPPDHYPGLEVLWYGDTGPMSTSKRLRTTNDGRLCFANVEASDAGSYYCLVQTNFQSQGEAANFKRSPTFVVTTVSGSGSESSRPQVVVEVPDVTVKSGKDVTLECFFSGNPHPMLEWRRKSPADVPLPSSSNTASINQELFIRNAQPEDSGKYVCLATNDVESDVKSTGILTVVSAPVWVEELEDTDIDIMSSLTWHCEADSRDDITYTWYRNAEPISTDFNRISFSDNFRTASFSSLEESDSAMYQCVASNEHGSVISTSQLKVNAIPPSFPIPVQMNQPAAKGGSVTIFCAPEGAPKPTIEWYRDSTKIATGGRFNVTEDGSLHITGVLDTDLGNYRCEATNTFSKETSTGSLVIKDATVIIRHPAVTTYVIGDNGLIECDATADEEFELIYIWLFAGRQLNIDDNPHYRKENGNLHLFDITQEMHGEYTCRAETSIDAAMSSATITVSGPPDPPTAIDVILEELLAEVSWMPGMEHNSEITGFVIESKTNHLNSDWMEEKTVNAISLMATVNDLSPWSIYQFRVRAISGIGLGEPSAPSAEVETPTAGPTVSPTGVSGGGGNQGDLRITWQPLASIDQNGPGIYYTVHWRREGSMNQFATAEVRTGDDVHIISNVEVYTPFEVKLQAGNEVGTGPISQPSIVYSYQEAPKDPPTMVDVTPTSDTEVLIKWDPVDDSRFKGVVIGYRIYYWPEGSSLEEADTVETEGTSTTAMLDKLEAATTYYIVIEARSGGGEGPGSQTILIETKKLAPLTSPEIETASVQNDNSVKLTWSAITTGKREESLSGYKILYWKKGTFMDSAVSVKVAKSETSVTLKMLDPTSTYFIKVQGYSAGGDGALSEQEEIETGKPQSDTITGDNGGSGHMTTSFTSLIGSLLLLSMLLLLN